MNLWLSRLSCRRKRARVKFRNRIEQLHTGADGGIKMECLLYIPRYLLNGLVGLPVQKLFPFGKPGENNLLLRNGFKSLFVSGYPIPQPPQEAVRTLYCPIIPLGVLFRRADKESIEPHRIRAVAGNQSIGTNNVTLGFGHLCPVLYNHSLGKQARERLFKTNLSQIV